MSGKMTFLGQLDRKVKVTRYEVQATSTGSRDRIAVDLGEFWAHMRDSSGGQDVDDKVYFINNREYTIRYTVDIKPGMVLSLTDDGVEYEVVHVVEVQRRRMLKLVCNLKK